MAGDPDKAWFETWRDGQRLKAVPVSPPGWIALMLLVAFPVGVVALVMQTFPKIAPAGFVTTLIFSLAIVFVVVRVLLRHKSRPRG